MKGTGLLGKKIGMTQIFDDAGACVPVTVIQVGPCTVVDKKTQERDGYSALQLGYEPIEDRKVNRPKMGHFKKAGVKPFRYLREVRLSGDDLGTVGQALDISLFAVGDKIDVMGTSKGKGFQGVIKRHGFSGGPGAHGSHFHRVPGSIGQCTSPGEVHKGQKMPGRTGGNSVTVRNLRVVALRADDNVLLIRGAIPGPNDGIVFLRMDEALFQERAQAAVPAEVAEESVEQESAAEEAVTDEKPAEAEGEAKDEPEKATKDEG